jgi:hypothetical protein
VGAISFDVRIGSVRASGNARASNQQLLSLSATLTMDGAGGHCLVDLAASDATPPKPGSPFTIDLDDGSGSVRVFTGEAQRTEVSPSRVRVAGADGLSKAAGCEVQGVYEKTSAGAIVKDLLGQAGLTVGDVSDGPQFPSYVVRRGPSALRLLQRLAEECGCDVFTDGDGKVHFAPPRTGAPDHSFTYKVDLLELDLQPAQPVHDGVVLWGESAASSMGANRAHWLVTKLASVKGEAKLSPTGLVTPGQGSHPLTVLDGAVRTGADASDLAKARATALAARPVRGSVTVLGRPAVKPGDLVRLSSVPKTLAVGTLTDGTLRVRQVRHVLDLTQGFVTRMEL